MGAFISVPQTEEPRTVIIDEVDSTTSYIGMAIPGTTTSEALWQIRKSISTGGDIDIRFAENGEFNQVWDDRASLSYP